MNHSRLWSVAIYLSAMGCTDFELDRALEPENLESAILRVDVLQQACSCDRVKLYWWTARRAGKSN